MDWVNATFLIAIGFFLGLAADGMMQLVTTAFWPVVVITVLLFVGVLLFDSLLSRLSELIFPSGIKPARNPKKKGPMPLPLLLSIPAGMLIGIVIARLGFGSAILDLLP